MESFYALFGRRCEICQKNLDDDFHFCFDCSTVIANLQSSPIKTREIEKTPLFYIFDYQSTSKDFLLGLKRNPTKKNAVLMSKILIEKIPAFLRKEHWVCVPPRRFQEIHFLELLSVQLQINGTHINNQALYSNLFHFKTQKALNKKYRKKNVSGKFIANKKCNLGKKEIILFDDLVTTGQTLQQCTHVLMKQHPELTVKGYVSLGYTV